MAAFIVLDYQNLTGQFTINADKIIKYERQSHFTTVFLDGGMQEQVKQAPDQIAALIRDAQSHRTI
ncbi:MAG TPA: hypothetical protein VNZ53_39565 [Steroidobacteraceae bacterium]|jgi:hypothetical protein|nr:hypothetical protein [Steroidobacteraceae bacterium]